ncbi:MAG: ABC transporter ATP-binding protein [Actinomycetota bacterium]
MASLRLDGVDIAIDRDPVLTDLDLTVPDGSLVAVIGPSGTGKSTLLRAVAGLADIRRGQLLSGGVDISELPTGQRDIGMVFQEPALLPRRTGRGNVGFPLEIRREEQESIRRRVGAEADALRISHLMSSRPGQMSRGEQQMVQIARVLIRTPTLMLLDEPFASLDAHLRRRMRAEIRMLQRSYGVTTLMATNDPEDVVALADLVIILGRVDARGSGQSERADGPSTALQVGTPTEVHGEPSSLTVATTTGPIWTTNATVVPDGSGFWLRSTPDPSGSSSSVDDHFLRLRAWSPVLAAHRGHEVVVGIRPEDLRTVGGETNSTARAGAGGETVRPGPTLDVVASGPAGGDQALRATFERQIPGTELSVMCRWGRTRLYAGAGVVATPEPGQVIDLVVDRWCVFDPMTGDRIA